MAIDYGRLRAVLALRGSTVGQFARRIDIGERRLFAVCNNEQPLTATVVDAIRRELGDDGWRWVSRQSNMLVAPGGSPTSTTPSTENAAAR